MHGRKSLLFAALALGLAGCSSNLIMKPDCHSCTVEDQEWNAFSWNALPGQWKGSVETFQNQKAAKKSKKESKVDLRFLTAGAFLDAHKASSCGSLPANALVLNGLLWAQEKTVPTEYEAFVPVEDNKVAYGRLSFEKVNGQQVCNFRRLGPVMGKNRLALPTVSFAQDSNLSGRGLASVVGENELSLEFLRFAPEAQTAKDFQPDGRKPASAELVEKPALMIRVYKVSTRTGGERGQWSGTEESIYRLWKVD